MPVHLLDDALDPQRLAVEVHLLAVFCFVAKKHVSVRPSPIEVPVSRREHLRVGEEGKKKKKEEARLTELDAQRGRLRRRPRQQRRRDAHAARPRVGRQEGQEQPRRLGLCAEGVELGVDLGDESGDHVGGPGRACCRGRAGRVGLYDGR